MFNLAGSFMAVAVLVALEVVIITYRIELRENKRKLQQESFWDKDLKNI